MKYVENTLILNYLLAKIILFYFQNVDSFYLKLSSINFDAIFKAPFMSADFVVFMFCVKEVNVKCSATFSFAVLPTELDFPSASELILEGSHCQDCQDWTQSFNALLAHQANHQ